MLFRTALSIPPSPFKLCHTHKSMTIGSCFSQHIGQRLQKYKFNCISNPFGTVFNPISIANILKRALLLNYIDHNELISAQDMWVHLDFHSSLCAPDKNISLHRINHTIDVVNKWLRELHFLFITLGTSSVYRHIDTGHIVSNCHKIPAKNFQKINLTPETGMIALKDLLRDIITINPDIHIVLTISPVRHIKDGLIDNSFSKARLHVMVEQLQSELQNTSYFPAYEWLMDDLRDYRYYSADMIHPDEQAIEYIWQQFDLHFFDQNTRILNKQLDRVTAALHHRPFNPSSQAHQKFICDQLLYFKSLQKKYPHLDLEAEIDQLLKGAE